MIIKFKGTPEVNAIVDLTLSGICGNFSVNKKTAMKLFCDSMIRNLVLDELYGMIEYLLSEEEDKSDEH